MILLAQLQKRQNAYNFLISEERIQNNQIKLAERIVKDFDSVFRNCFLEENRH